MKKTKHTIISCILSSVMTIGFINIVPEKAWALTVDQLYANAYNATKTTLSAKTQKSVNDARTAIIALKGTGAAWAIGEFSKQVDTVQHTFLLKAVNAITAAQANPTQVNINTAKASIDPDMPAVWRNSYSQAVDIVQQGLMTNAEAACNKAFQTKAQADIDTANKMLAEIKTAADTGVSNWANELQTRLSGIAALPTFGTLGNVSLTVNGVQLIKTIVKDAAKTDVYNIKYTDNNNISSTTALYITDLQRNSTIPALGTTAYLDVYDILLNNVAYNLYVSTALKALNVTSIDIDNNPVTIISSLEGSNIVYTISSGFYKTVKYTFVPKGNSSFQLSY